VLEVFLQDEGGSAFPIAGMKDGFSGDLGFHRVPGVVAVGAFFPANDGITAVAACHCSADDIAVALGAVHGGGLGAEVMGHGNDQSTGVLVVEQLVARSCLTGEAVLQDP